MVFRKLETGPGYLLLKVPEPEPGPEPGRDNLKYRGLGRAGIDLVFTVFVIVRAPKNTSKHLLGFLDRINF